MTPRDTIGQLLVNEPLAQVALVFIGSALLWWELRHLRRRLTSPDGEGETRKTQSTQNSMIAMSMKMLLLGLFTVLFGLCLLLASIGILPAPTALAFFAMTTVPIIAAMVYFMIWGAPARVISWLLKD